MDDPLELVGVDLPNYSTPGISPPPQLNAPQSFTGLSSRVTSESLQGALGRANQLGSQTIERASTNVQSKAQQELATIQAQQQQKLRDEMQRAQRQAQTGDVISGLAQTAAQFLLQKQQMDDQKKLRVQEEAQRQQAAMREANYQQLQAQVFAMVTDGEKEGYGKLGTERYTAKVEELLRTTDVDPEKAAELRKYAYESAQKHNQTVTQRLEKEQDEQRTAIVETAANQLKLETVATLGEFSKNPYQDPSIVTQFLQGKAKEVMENPNYTQTQKTQLLGRLYGEAAPYLQSNREAMGQLNVMQRNLQEYQSAVTNVWQRQAAGQLSIAEANYQQKLLQQQYNMDGASYDPTDNINYQEAQNRLTRVDPAQRNAYVEEVNNFIDKTMPYSEQELNARAYSLAFHQGGAGLNLLMKKENPSYSDKDLITRAQAMMKAKQDTTDFQSKAASLRSDLARINASNIEEAVRLATSGGQNSQMSEFFALLAAKDPTIAAKVTSGRQLTQQDVDLINSSKQEFIRVKQQELALIEQQGQQANQTLAQFGLQGDYTKYITNGLKQYQDKTNKRNQTLNQKIAQDQAARSQMGNIGIQPFTEGQGESRNFVPTRNDLQTTNDFKRTVIGGKDVILPFDASIAATITSGHGVDRGTHKHAGIDFAVPLGTALYTPIRGKVIAADNGVSNPGGYGHFVDILGEDGMLYRYTHLQEGGIKVRKGDVIEAGTMFAKSGNTGRSSGAHLHLEIRKPGEGDTSSYGFEGTVNPLQYLAGKKVVLSRTGGARSAGLPEPPTVNGQVQTQAPIPKNAMALSSGFYVADGQVFAMTSFNPQPIAFTNARPMANSYFDGKTKNYDDTRNLGYAKLARDNDLRKALHETSRELGVPSEWMADIIAYESAGSFSSSIVGAPAASHGGATPTGLIQFMPSTLKSLGYTVEQAKAMTPAQQMRTLVREYFRRGVKEVGEFKDVGEMYLYVFGGGSAVRRYRKDPAGFDISDGYNNFRSIASKLGASVGRQHTLAGVTRKDRIATATHTTYQPNCKVCASLQASNSPIVPHQGQT